MKIFLKTFIDVSFNDMVAEKILPV